MQPIVMASLALIAAVVIALMALRRKPDASAPAAAAEDAAAAAAPAAASCQKLERPALDSAPAVDRPMPGETGFGSLKVNGPRASCTPDASLDAFFPPTRCDVPTDDYVVLKATGSPADKPFSQALPHSSAPMACV